MPDQGVLQPPPACTAPRDPLLCFPIDYVFWTHLSGPDRPYRLWGHLFAARCSFFPHAPLLCFPLLPLLLRLLPLPLRCTNKNGRIQSTATAEHTNEQTLLLLMDRRGEIHGCSARAFLVAGWVYRDNVSPTSWF